VLKPADFRADDHVVNGKKVQRNWREEGLRIVPPRRKRCGTTTYAISGAVAPKVVWAIDFQFESLRCGTPVKLAYMADKYTLESRLDSTDTSITSERHYW